MTSDAAGAPGGARRAAAAALAAALACTDALDRGGGGDGGADARGGRAPRPPACEGITESGYPDLYFLDGDGDGFGGEQVMACELPEGAVKVGGDCLDDDPEIHPDAEDVCDGLDNDCDGFADLGLLWGTIFLDGDGDGFGDAASAQEGCPRAGFTDRGGDCNDGDPAVNPDADEPPGSPVDTNCDGVVTVTPHAHVVVGARADPACGRVALVAWFKDAPSGLFQDPVPVHSPCDLAPGADVVAWALPDVDGDGVADLEAQHSDGALWQRTRAPDGSFSAAAQVATLPAGAALKSYADTDGDGDLDVVIGTQVGGGLAIGVLVREAPDALSAVDSRVLLGDDLTPGDQPWRFPTVVRDLTGDGCADLTAGFYGPPALVHVAPGRCDGTFGALEVRVSAPAAPWGLESWDVDRDGDADLVTGSDDDGEPGQTYLWRNNGDGTFAAGEDFVDFLPAAESGNDQWEGPGICYATDLDGDVWVDLVCSHGGWTTPNQTGGVRFGNADLDWSNEVAPMLSGAPFPAWVAAPLLFATRRAPAPDAGPDAAPDAGAAAPPDAGRDGPAPAPDAGPGAARDAGVDAGAD